mmetsp:Transcript_66807/g.129238  ORF Transcript_66807/g.129238 Transcript_66807/m.129238 type:complete len:204 (-) Transcript_66807:334-945(-)
MFFYHYFHKKEAGSKGSQKPVLAESSKSTALRAAMQLASSGLETVMRSLMPCDNWSNRHKTELIDHQTVKGFGSVPGWGGILCWTRSHHIQRQPLPSKVLTEAMQACLQENPHSLEKCSLCVDLKSATVLRLTKPLPVCLFGQAVALVFASVVHLTIFSWACLLVQAVASVVVAVRLCRDFCQPLRWPRLQAYMAQNFQKLTV